MKNISMNPHEDGATSLKNRYAKEKPNYLIQKSSVFLLALLFLSFPQVFAQNQMEFLDRGVVAVRKSSNEVFVSWRMFGTDPTDIAFNLYRGGTLVNAIPITQSTNYVDSTVYNSSYTVRPIIGGVEQAAFGAANVWDQGYFTLDLQRPSGGTTPDGVNYDYSPNDCSVADLDGDGDYEIIVKWDPSNAKDNSQSGYTGNVFIDAYTLEGEQLWRIDLGRNIRAGAHYTQFMVYDLDGDGKAELACRTADAAIDGVGTIIGDINADYRNSNGYILSGPEYLTIFNGETGAEMATTNFEPARGNVGDWGDTYGNRVDRFLAAVAYLDGVNPSLVMCRGYYELTMLVAWDWQNGTLSQRWVFDSRDTGNEGYAQQGAHSLTVGDVDADGKDEIVYGAATIDDDGTGLYSTGLGHGDALHLSDMDPDREGLEVFMVHESPSSYGEHGVEMHDAATGEIIWSRPGDGSDIGRGVAMDIDPTYKGYEAWGSRGGLNSATGVQISTSRPGPMNFASWWDGDLIRELLDGTTISKWDYTNFTNNTLLNAFAYGAASNNSTKATPNLSADILGDWREEVIWRHQDNDKLLIFTTTIPTEHKLYTLMHDPQYRTAVAWQNVGYNQPPHPGFYLGADMDPAPIPDIQLVAETTPPPLVNLGVVSKNGVVDLDWLISGANADLDIYRGISNLFPTSSKITSLTAGTTVFSDTTVTNGTDYYYWVTTLDANGDTVISNAAASSPNITEITLEATAGDSLVTLNWEISGISGSQIVYRDGDEDPDGRVNIASLNSLIRTYTDTSVANDSTYYYWIEALDGDSISVNSNMAMATPTKPQEPVIIQENEIGFCSVEGTVDSNNAGFTGDGFANTDNAVGTGIEWRIKINESGEYEILFGYANGANDRPGDLIIDGVNMGNVSLLPTGGWTTWGTSGIMVSLDTGEHDIRLEATTSGGLANIDYIGIRGEKGTTQSAAACVYTPAIALTATTSSSSVDLSWTVEYATFVSQEVYKDSMLVATLNGTITSYTDTAVVEGDYYSYWVSGVFEDSTTLNSNVLDSILVPAVPEIILNAEVNVDEVLLTWTLKNTSFRHHEIFRDTDPNPSGRSRVGSVSNTTFSFIDDTVEPDTVYYYWIKGIYNDGSNLNSNGAEAIIPPTPTLSLTVVANDTDITLDWAVQNITFDTIEVYRSSSLDSADFEFIASVTDTSQSFTDTTATAGNTYYYWIKGVTESNYTLSSNVVEVYLDYQILTVKIQEDELGFCGVDGRIDHLIPGFTGNGYTNTYYRKNARVTWAIEIPIAGSYEFTFRFHNGLLYKKPARLYLNDSLAVANIGFKAEPDWLHWNTWSFTMELAEGTNYIALESSSFKGLPYLDYLEITGLGVMATSCESSSSQRQVANIQSTNSEENLNSELMVFPNPVSAGSVTFNSFLFDNSEVKVAITNTEGKRVYVKELGTFEAGEIHHTLDITDLSSGIYILQLQYKDGMQTVNFVKQ
ncbi:carbohydrate-binding protein (plasmid) [Chondrinema litorale]|nr:carbohydrate-binding protein [Chondrinema litorale]UZR99835.1 carbohydrate-binding protein [Chondrinema litorale]